MAATNFKTQNNTFRKLIGNGLTYRVPRFQRDYSWEESEWEDLWLDIGSVLAPGGESAHYMGYLVLQSADDRRFDVIDGQQRLTTLSILVLAIMKNLQRLVDQGIDVEANTQRLTQIRQTYVGYLDPVSLEVRSKLTLNRNNNGYYQHHMVQLQPVPRYALLASEHRLRKAFEWFERKVGQHLKSEGGTDPGRWLAQLVESISDGLFFTVITVTDELNAYKVFETLNARDVQLSSTDLLKNYLFSVLDQGGNDDHHLRSLEARWEEIVGRLKEDSFPDFLRAHWNSRHGFARQAELFKTIRHKIRTPEQVFILLRELAQDLDTWLALSSPDVSDWSVCDREHARILRTFRVRQPFPLLLAGRRSLEEKEFSGLLRATVVISLRYNVICAYGTAEQERTYNTVAQGLAKGELRGLHDVLQGLRSIYVEDRPFRAAFGDKSIRTTDSRNNRVVRFILCAMEKHLSGKDLNVGSDLFGVEHVLPQHADDRWDGFQPDEAEALVYRLGNMTLLESAMNREAGNQPYSAKRVLYERSEFAVTRRLAQENAGWSADRISARQAWMADQATSIWRIAQLDIRPAGQGAG
ncbi:MAG: DUF262 domain-containing HNH endonuclease family protein [Lautropia sp.]|nr:DUF262 domain-containing HNH endonuclease family protein [Lautropia sp.]